jgi:hypothetical protein
MRDNYLAHHWEEGGKVSLSHFPDGSRGFLVEASYDESPPRAVVLRSFKRSVPLGSINRARLEAYESSTAYRYHMNAQLRTKSRDINELLDQAGVS